MAPAGHVGARDEEALRTVRREGRRFFPALRGDGPALLLELDPFRAGYDVVAGSLPTAEHAAAEVAAALG